MVGKLPHLILLVGLCQLGCNSVGQTTFEQQDLTKNHVIPAELAAQSKQSREFHELMTAVSLGDKAAVLSVLRKGVRANVSDEAGRTPLLIASSNGNAEIVQILIENGADVNARLKNTLTPYGFTTPLWAAANYKGDVQTIRELLSAGAFIETRDMDGETPLMAAARRGDVEVVKTFVAAGAQVNATHSQNHGTALMNAAGWGRTEVVRVLLPAGADVNAQQTSGHTALMLAAEQGYTNIVKELIAAGADVNVRTNNNDSALTLAEKGKRKDIVTLLELAGATR
jgi:ankyrin repeat protein